MISLIAQACDASGGVSEACLNTFIDTIQGGTGRLPAGNLTPRGIINNLLPYLFTFGGIILLVMIIWGGFEMLTGAADPKSQEAGKQRITNAVVGFALLFTSYWLAQLVETIFGVSIL